MSKVPPNQDQLNEVDQLYRRLSALDPGRPGEWVRRKVQAYATQQAAERAVRANAKAKESSSSESPIPIAAAVPTAAKPAANRRWLLPVLFGAIAAAAIVGFLVLPRLMAPSSPPRSALLPVPASQPETATPEVEQASAPPLPEPASPAPPSTPLQSTAPESAALPPPAPATTSLAQTSVEPQSLAQTPVGPPSSAPPASKSFARTPLAPPASAPPAPVVASSSAGTPPAQSLARARVARQNAAALRSAPMASDRAETTSQAARSAPTADPALAPTIPSSTDTQLASAPPPPAAAPATQPAPTSAVAASYPPDGFWLAAKSGDMSGLQTALAGNIDVNALDADGHTALILAIQSNRIYTVRALLAHGANPNTADSHGLTPLRAARIRANLAILMALERNGRR